MFCCIHSLKSVITNHFPYCISEHSYDYSASYEDLLAILPPNQSVSYEKELFLTYLLLEDEKNMDLVLNKVYFYF